MVEVKQAAKITLDALRGLITLVIILGGILGGIFTAIEAGAVACIWAFLVTMFIYRDYRWKDLPVLLHRTLRTVAMVMTLIACASKRRLRHGAEPDAGEDHGILPHHLQ